MEHNKEIKEYKGQYNRIFPAKVSTTSFLTIYTLYMFQNKKSFYGKELIDEIQNRFGGNWKISHGIIYPMLRKLEEQGLLIGTWEDNAINDKRTKRLYQITPKGKEVVKELLEKYYSIFIESYNIVAQILIDLYDKDNITCIK